MGVGTCVGGCARTLQPPPPAHALDMGIERVFTDWIIKVLRQTTFVPRKSHHRRNT